MENQISRKSGFRLGLSQTEHAVALLPLAAFFEQFDPFKPLQYATFAAEGGADSETSML